MYEDIILVAQHPTEYIKMKMYKNNSTNNIQIHDDGGVDTTIRDILWVARTQYHTHTWTRRDATRRMDSSIENARRRRKIYEQEYLHKNVFTYKFRLTINSNSIN